MTKKQKVFCEEYLKDLNATQAAIRAGYSPKSAGTIGNENMQKLQIRACIDKALAERSKRTGVNVDRVVLELARMAFVNPADVINFDGATIEEDASRDDTAAIHSVKVKRIPSEHGEILEREIRLVDKNKPLELLGKHLGMYTDKLNISGDMLVKVIDNIPEGKDD